MAKVGFIGLGNMGRGMCKNLIEAGNEVTVFDANTQMMEKFSGKAKLAADIMEVHGNSDYIFFSLPNSDVVESIVNQFLQAGMSGKIIIDTSTSYPVSTRELCEKVKAAGGNYVDAGLMGGPGEAEAGDLEAVKGGDTDVMETVEPLFEAICRKHFRVGESGCGHLAKVAVNFCAMTEIAMLAQIYPVMAKFGIEPPALYDILNCEALDNWVFQFYSKKYVNKNYPLDFALSLGLKDLTYGKKLFDELNIPGFVLDGAIDLCRITLKDQKPGETFDMSYICQKMYDLAGVK